MVRCSEGLSASVAASCTQNAGRYSTSPASSVASTGLGAGFVRGALSERKTGEYL